MTALERIARAEFDCVVCDKHVVAEWYERERRPICRRCVESATCQPTWNGSARNVGGWNLPGTTRSDKDMLRRIAALRFEIEWEAYRASH